MTQAPAAVPIEEGDRDFVQSVAKGLLVLRAFSADRPSLTVADLARETGLSRAAVRRIVLTLQALGYLGAQGRRLALRPRVLDLGYALMSSAGLSGLVQSHLDVLEAEVREHCSAGIFVDGEVVYIARAQSRRVLSVVTDVGARLPAASTAIGRVLLSGLDDAEIREHVARRPPTAHTHLSITDPERVLEEVRTARLNGFALASEELELGYRAVAVPLHGADGSILAAVNVRMHVGRVSLEEALRDVVPRLRLAAGRVERDLALHPLPF
ncbi:helix-turn-helix domain-containing protein [Nocardioides sp. zg-579]|uniref:Helix-turn-helix domain-containing protein n=1 Tax=Nocardioides marmotae TaxID=2663857 RepID=A0A6I3J910_9ACTN|nr:IclR family transcriptional regulator C-terminal domain-containing protein [Nocardioides marmotae]MCR6030248.1 helix-turn-helix domain-containing protein [Gordonia jinghuaiqii]MTB93880.1 helix-turn-helix domain-containing protein [Nocardioides marmotae]QKE00203.1 helix-turn-helix domain-containing protein [Nocardioides marmotae]